ncbi:MAG: hypothetical protein J6386_11120 [Candidatus Synoicihabitans palmerolidicus]|nr:hypothetical protein [Candidatus Synoicihabitans palmerolidicus]
MGACSLPAGRLDRWDGEQELTAKEKELLKQLPQIGHDLLVTIPRCEQVTRIILYIKKDYNGGGFPEDDVAGEAIPLVSRMLRILLDRLALDADGIVKDAAEMAMTREAEWYDPDLLELSFECFPAYLNQPLNRTDPVKTMRYNQLVPGQVLVSDIDTPDGMVLLHAGSKLTAMVISRLRNHHLLYGLKDEVTVQISDDSVVRRPAA